MLTGLQALTPWHKKDKIIKNKKDESNFESDKTVEENNFLKVLYRPVGDDPSPQRQIMTSRLD